ncbi:CinA family protein [Alteromonas halophila]|uniref:Competence damage-inducible protein A n=1 Tax=Alteromonas halophila TaxID=516698 RepID=A0A918JCV1_9ALTE|nr:CinA family protein [Alteromonas halophila]GGW72770.1 competence damage-inducible protein A [Alteromonas halophila]
MENRFAINPQDIATLGDKLRARGWNVSCAESCTGGGLAYYFTQVAGSSDWFSQSWVTYSNAAKQSALGVTAETLQQHGAVSRETVREMANGVQRNTGAEVAVSVSGVAGPGGGSAEKPVGTVWFGFLIDGHAEQIHMQFDGDRQSVREQAIGFVIAHLNNQIETLPQE